MSLSSKYNIPENTVKKMVKDGVISCSAARYQEVYDKVLHLKSTNPGTSNNQLFYLVSEDLKMSYESVKKIFYIMVKNT